MLTLKTIVKYLVPGIVIVLMCCVEPYELPVGEGKVHFLIVDGFLNTADGTVNVNLLRATTITTANFPVESGAAVALEDSDGDQIFLNESTPGRYTGTASVVFDNTYRLYIRTIDEKEYRSAFISIKPTPEIKEVGWKAYPDGTQIIVDTEDVTNSTHYYRWTFEETWEYHSRYHSYWYFNESGMPAPRNRDQMVDICYRTVASTKIFTTTTAGFTEDRVNDYELPFLPVGTEKLGYGYSILVKQYAITKETYEYLEKLKKTSQDQGGLYTPQPSTVKGNIINIADPTEVVLGYFDAGQAVEKRISIKPQDLPAHLRKLTPDSQICYEDTARLTQLNFLVNSKDFLLVNRYVDDMNEFEDWDTVYTYSFKECVDCRLKGGVTSKPGFWP